MTNPTIDQIRDMVRQTLDEQFARYRLVPQEESRAPEWLSLKEACELKGVNYKTIANRRYLQPNGGEGTQIGGIRKWRREVILDWILLGDDSLAA